MKFVINASTTATTMTNLQDALRNGVNCAVWARKHATHTTTAAARQAKLARRKAAEPARKAAKAAEAKARAEKLALQSELETENQRRRKTNAEARKQLLPWLVAFEAAKTFTGMRFLYEGPRQIEKAPRVELWNYTFRQFGASVVLKKAFDALSKANGLIINDGSYDACQQAVEIFADLEAKISSQRAAGKPFAVKADKATIQIGRQSLAAELLRINPGAETWNLIEVEHSVAKLDLCKKLKSILGNGNVAIGESRIETLRENIVNILTSAGVDVIIDGNAINYVAFAYTASKGKTGSFYAIQRTIAENKLFAKAISLGVKFYGDGAVPMSGAEIMKERAVLFTPSAPIITKNLTHLFLDDILMCDAIKRRTTYQKALVVGPNGIKATDNVEEVRNEGDGSAFFVDADDSVLSGQLRGFGIKAMLNNVPGIVEFIAKLDGKPMPDLDGKRIIATTDIWKMSKLGLSWEEFVERVNLLAKYFPTINMLRVVRNADSAEDNGTRQTSRQLLQQLMSFVAADAKSILQRDIRWLRKFQTFDGAVKHYSAAHKADEDKTAYERIFAACPDLLAADQMVDDVEARWNDRVAEVASGKVTVDGYYPYIVTDPVAIIRILLFGSNPDTEQGLLAEGTVHCPEVEDGRKVLLNRYPSNFFNAIVAVNKTCTDDMRVNFKELYAGLGNVMVLPYKSVILVIADGDVDGDEMSVITTDWMVNQMELLLKEIHQDETRKVIVFPHEKAEMKLFATKEALDEEIARSVLLANTFGGEVGKNSLMATKYMHRAMIALKCSTRKHFNQELFDAIYAYVGSILAIDLVKTGCYPNWLVKKLKSLNKYSGLLPWNELFKRAGGLGWRGAVQSEASGEDPEYRQESQYAIVDVMARRLIDIVGAEDWTFDREGHSFDVASILDGTEKQARKGVLPKVIYAQINLRNALPDGDDRKILRQIRDGEIVSPSELLRFFWRNAAAMSRKMKRGEATSSREADALQREAYYAFVRDTMLQLGDYASDEERIRIISNFALNMAFNKKNGVGKDANDEQQKRRLQSSFCTFVLKVFAVDVLRNLGVDAKAEAEADPMAIEPEELVF